MGYSNGCGRKRTGRDAVFQGTEGRTKPIILIVVLGSEAEHGMRKRASQRVPFMTNWSFVWVIAKGVTRVKKLDSGRDGTSVGPLD